VRDSVLKSVLCCHLLASLLCCRVLWCWQGVAVCCSVLQYGTVCYSDLELVLRCCLLASLRYCRALQCDAVWCGMLQSVAVCCSVLQCVAVCCSVLQCATVCCAVRCSAHRALLTECGALFTKDKALHRKLGFYDWLNATARHDSTLVANMGVFWQTIGLFSHNIYCSCPSKLSCFYKKIGLFWLTQFRHSHVHKHLSRVVKNALYVCVTQLVDMWHDSFCDVLCCMCDMWKFKISFSKESFKNRHL